MGDRVIGETPEAEASSGELHQQALERFPSASILVSEDLEVLHVGERAGRYLVVSGGEPTRELVRLVLPELRVELRAALDASRRAGEATEAQLVRVELDGRARQVRMSVRALRAAAAAHGRVLVTFAEFDDQDPDAPHDPHAARPLVQRLEDELQRTRGQLRHTLEASATSVEELHTSNEELQAMNEELRAVTEELQAGKEELQSVNEELITLNRELHDQVEQVNRANGDLQNLMSCADLGVVFLDRLLHIQRFTPRALDVFNLLPTDVGRPITDLTHPFEGVDLEAHARAVLQSLRVFAQEVRTTEGSRYLLRVHPYRSLEDRIEGVVLTFLDVTERRAAEDAVRDREAMLRLAERAAATGTWELDAPEHRLRLSEEGRRLFGFELAAALTLEDWLARVIEPDRARVRQALHRREEIDLELRIRIPGGGERRLWILGQPNASGTGVAGVVLDAAGRPTPEA